MEATGASKQPNSAAPTIQNICWHSYRNLKVNRENPVSQKTIGTKKPLVYRVRCPLLG